MLLSSSLLTSQKWTGFVRYVNNTHEFLVNKSLSTTNQQKPHTMLHVSHLNSLNTCQTFECNISQAKWTSNEHFLIGHDSGEVSLVKVLGDVPNQRGVFYENRMTRVEHDGAVVCLETMHECDVALSGSMDAT